MPGNLDLALRIRADLGNAKQALDRLERELKQTGAAGQAASRGTGQAARNVDRLGNAIERLEQSVAKSGLLEWLANVTDHLTDAVDKAERHRRPRRHAGAERRAVRARP